MSGRFRLFAALLLALMGVSSHAYAYPVVPGMADSPPAIQPIGVPGPAILTQHNDTARTGANLSEQVLNTANVNVRQFGELFTRPVDGHIYAQPLYVPQVTMPGKGTHNVVYVATMHNSVYAFDADDPAAVDPLWQTNLGPSALISSHDFGPPDYSDIQGEVGILGTPVVDLESGTIYVVALTRETQPATCPCAYQYRLHALDLASGVEKLGGPALITGAVPGAGEGSQSGTLNFDSRLHIQRAALLLSSGVIYIAFASFGDQGPYHGWVMGYDAATLEQSFIYNVTPDGKAGGIWQAGQGLAADSIGDVYAIAGNGTFDAHTGGADYGNTFIKLGPFRAGQESLITDWFTPYDQNTLDASDMDVGSTGPMLIPGTNLLLGAGKSGLFYVLDRNAFGHYGGADGVNHVVQSFHAGGPFIMNSPVYWNSPDGPRVYVWGGQDYLKAYRMEDGLFVTSPDDIGRLNLNGIYAGAALSLSANGSQPGSGIVWASHPMKDASNQAQPGVLRAYDASNLQVELWNSTLNANRDAVGNYAKFSPPTVAGGKVYLATFSGQLDVYGLLAYSSTAGPDAAP